jgi:hypothetical protein
VRRNLSAREENQAIIRRAYPVGKPALSLDHGG